MKYGELFSIISLGKIVLLDWVRESIGNKGMVEIVIVLFLFVLWEILLKIGYVF